MRVALMRYQGPEQRPGTCRCRHIPMRHGDFAASEPMIPANRRQGGETSVGGPRPWNEQRVFYRSFCRPRSAKPENDHEGIRRMRGRPLVRQHRRRLSAQGRAAHPPFSAPSACAGCGQTTSRRCARNCSTGPVAGSPWLPRPVYDVHLVIRGALGDGPARLRLPDGAVVAHGPGCGRLSRTLLEFGDGPTAFYAALSCRMRV